MRNNKFFDAYVEAALWSSIDDDGVDMISNFDRSDIDEESLEKMKSDCDKFQKENEALLEQAGDDRQNGYDFWLTRNHHGAGFWDRDYEQKVADALTEAAHAFGESYLIVCESEDGNVYLGSY